MSNKQVAPLEASLVCSRLVPLVVMANQTGEDSWTHKAEGAS